MGAAAVPRQAPGSLSTPGNREPHGVPVVFFGHPPCGTASREPANQPVLAIGVMLGTCPATTPALAVVKTRRPALVTCPRSTAPLLPEAAPRRGPPTRSA